MNIIANPWNHPPLLAKNENEQYQNLFVLDIHARRMLKIMRNYVTIVPSCVFYSLLFTNYRASERHSVTKWTGITDT